MSQPYRFSLVTATLGRTHELTRLLESLTRQTTRDFEVIVVDQNPPGTLDEVLQTYRSRLSLVQIASPVGLSRARNIGIGVARGGVIAFPDDDCWYEPNTLRDWSAAYDAQPRVDGVLGRTLGPDGEPVHGMTHATAGRITRRNVWRRANGNGLSFRRRVFDVVGGFDETLGPGSGTRWGACEDADLPLRALAAGLALDYQPEIVIRHANPDFDNFSPVDARRRAASYGRGMGRVLRQRQADAATVACAMIRPLGGAILSMLCGKRQRAECYWLNWQGRCEGYWVPLITGGRS